MTDSRLAAADGYPPRIGRFVAMLEDTRRRTLRDLETLDEAYIDRGLPWNPNSIGTLVYHVAAIELDWTFADVLQTNRFPDGTEAWFPVDVRDEDGRLSPMVDSLAHHLERLSWVRAHLLEALRGLGDDDLDRLVSNADDGSTNSIAWILQHLMQHEAEHRGQIGELRNALRSQ